MSDNAKVAIHLTLQGASIVARGLGGITTGVAAVGTGFARTTATAAHFLAIGKDVVGLAGRMASGVGKFTESLIAPNIDFEDASVGFENLLGSADAAKKRIEALYAYANATPFMNADVLDAGIKLENAGGAALGMGKGLEMVGDMAAYARKDLSEVADWVARLYQNLQGGDPFMESARRLQELNVMTGKEVKALNELAESGAGGTQMWDAFTKMMEKTGGSAVKLGTTFSGMKSTVSGLWTEMKRMTGEKLFAAMKEDLGALSADMSNLFETGQVDKFAERFGTLIADLYEKLKGLAIGDLGLGDIMKAGLDGDIWSALKAGFGAVVYNFWQQMIHQARLYAPEIQAVLVPKRLQGMLGIDKGLAESMDERKARIGEAGYRDPAAAFRGGATGWSEAQGFDFTNARVMSHSQLMGGSAAAAAAAPQPRVIPTVAEFAGTAGTNQSAETINAAAVNTAGSMAAAEASAANVAKYLGEAAAAARRSAELNNAASRLGTYTPARF